jgi:hypothetical protein
MIETSRSQKAEPLGTSARGSRAADCEATRRLLLCVGAASCALIRHRIFLTIALCLVIWLANAWMAAAIAHAQELPANNTSASVAEPVFGQRSIAKEEAPPLVLSMVDRSARELSAPRNSAIHLSNPRITNLQGAGKAPLPSNPRGAEYASLAALASAPPPWLLHSVEAKGLGQQTDTSSQTIEKKTLVYQLGTISLMMNQLPNSFSVSSPGGSLPGAQ